ncbi:Kinesin light chain (KLC) [Durusdinium trenchii]|uniref:Kinesin light chain (KLC) n=1 Tax=Durusdinium trenchii TaxID=1381693 RepID=A0ABP0MSH3_9DINO
MKILGETDPATLTTLNNLGGLYFTWGRWAEAEPHFFAALEGRRAVLGRLDPATLQSANNLASLFQARGRLDKAEPLFRESLAGRRNILGAEELMNEALVGRRSLLGNLHKDTLTSLNNLAGRPGATPAKNGRLLRTRGKHDEAETLYEEALRGRKELLGSAHMDTLMTANNYGRSKRGYLRVGG